MKYSLQKIASWLEVPCSHLIEITGYRIDSRLVEPQDLFFALKGETTDGHHHLQQAKEKGAVAAVVSSSYTGPDWGLVLIQVDDPLLALQTLARHSLQEEKELKIIGVTGSVGKTTTKEFIATLLSGQYKTGKSERSYNTKRTLPITVLNRQEGLEVLVLEMGMSDPGDIRKLVEIAPPDIAVLTKVALAHAAFFPGGVEEIARGKIEIFSHPKTSLAILDHALHHFPEVVEKIAPPKLSFSIDDPKADYFLCLQGMGVIDERGVRAYQCALPFQQPHILHNLIAAIALARSLKIEWDVIHQQLPLLQLPSMRFEQFEKNGVLFINDAYNANPESMRAALSSLPEPKEGGKKIAVLGTMCDLGKFSHEAHWEVGRLARGLIDHLLVLGDEAAPLCKAFQESQKPAEFFLDPDPLVKRLKELIRFGDVVLVKGSRAMKMETLFEQLK
ncbi:MAG: UDP-N-acetylmuramoyl-tripeptide--D-alanyl-D-alanine ligase [Chlamydiia bacterium]|nr:UDP-N-acetylmuramoyl-tripeptide--D-alanyl-D-alanine ligase [Chlamydiia bacterium]